MAEITDEEFAELQALRAEAEKRASEPAEPAPDQLTPDEIREFRRLQKEAADRASKDREALKVAVQKRTGPTHYVHLADGRVIKLAGGNLVTHHDGIPVLGAFEMSDEDKAAAKDEELAALEG